MFVVHQSFSRAPDYITKQTQPWTWGLAKLLDNQLPFLVLLFTLSNWTNISFKLAMNEPNSFSFIPRCLHGVKDIFIGQRGETSVVRPAVRYM